MRRKIKILHIPKTGGTAIKNHVKDNSECGLHVHKNHAITLAHSGPDTMFIIRDPIERFCSGFWGRKNYELRKELSLIDENKPYYVGGIAHTDFEKNIFEQTPTPNDFITKLRTNENFRKEFDENTSPLNLVTKSLTFWLSGPAKYKVLETNVVLAVELKDLTAVLKKYFNIEIENQSAFKNRSKSQFNFEQSYEVSFANREWFKDYYKPADYELIDYIKSRKYFARIVAED